MVVTDRGKTTRSFWVELLQRPEINSLAIPKHWLYGDEDFILLSKDYRGMHRVKLGVCLFECASEGKGGFIGKIHFLDKETKTQRMLFNFSIDRYQGLNFDDFFPFPIPEEHTRPGAHSLKPSQRERLPIITKLANNVQSFLYDMALGHAVNPKDFQTAVGNLVTYLYVPVKENPINFFPKLLDSPVSGIDISEFTEQPERKPTTEAEVAAKLAASYYELTGVSENVFQTIVMEYLDATGKTSHVLDSEWVARVMNALVDNQRYPLRLLIQEETSGETLQRCIREIHFTQANPNNGFC